MTPGNPTMGNWLEFTINYLFKDVLISLNIFPTLPFLVKNKTDISIVNLDLEIICEMKTVLYLASYFCLTTCDEKGNVYLTWYTRHERGVCSLLKTLETQEAQRR